MTMESDSPEFIYQYFVTEAVELLETIEATLYSLLEEKSYDKVHILMRSAHTLKSSAASVKQETISTIAHYLEDVFEALYPPELEIDPELGSLLLKGYECLKVPLNAVLSGLDYDEADILDQTATVFVELQAKLGDFFGREAPIPSSEELGFDVVGSIFTDSVPQDLLQLENVIATQDPEQIQTVLRTQAEFLADLGASYSLPGLEEIAKATLEALENHPDLVLSIAPVALENLQQSCVEIATGDRSRGGEVFPQLLSWSRLYDSNYVSIIDVVTVAEEEIHFNPEAHKAELETDFTVKTEIDSPLTSSQTDPLELSPILESKINIENPENENLSETEWNKSLSTSTSNSPLKTYALDQILESIGVQQSKTVKSVAPKTPKKKASSLSQNNIHLESSIPTIRVAIQQLDVLSHTIGELLIDDNQQNLQSEHMYRLVAKAIQDFRLCQQQLNKIHQWSNQTLLFPKHRQQKSFRNNLLSQSQMSQAQNSELGFDVLEMDTYNDLHLLLQTFESNMSRLGERVEQIKREFQQSNLNQRKRKQLLNRAQEELFQTRMVPLGTVLNRLPRTLQLIVATYHKPAELQLYGTEILVDKAITEKLYEPLLHLIRNAYDHGLEFPATRQSLGKTEIGRIRIYAQNQGNRTTIEVKDDGQGLDWEKIREKAIANKLLTATAAASASKAELAEILFEPGFTTVEEITDLSGRGVGLDVVRTQLQKVQGSISVKSEYGKGTSFMLQLPLNITTARLLVCQSHGVTYALLSEAISQILLPKPEEIQHRQSLITDESQAFYLWSKSSRDGETSFDSAPKVDKQLVPIRSLDELVNYQYPLFAAEKNSMLSPFPIKKRNSLSPLLLLETNDNCLGLQVEQILVEQELVIKSLGNMPNLPDYIQGYSVLGDSSLALVIDPVQLVEETWESTFSTSDFQLPKKSLVAVLETTEEPENSPPKLSLPFASDFSTHSSTVLVIEDSIVQRQSLVFTLEKAGYKVEQAANGQEAIALLQQNSEINLILCDMEMPVMNGFEFLANYRQNPSLSSIPVVMLTTRSGHKHRQLAKSLGAVAYLTKPYSESKLLESITIQLNQ